MAWTAKGMLISCSASVIHFSGLAVLRRRLTRSKITILTYHSVGASEGGAPSCLDLTGMRVSPREFRKQMEYVAKHYNTVTLEDVVRSRSRKSTLPPYPSVITFDDGYLDAYDNAVPVLEELGLKATFFLIGRPTASRELPWLHAIHEILDTAPTIQCISAFYKAAPDFFSTGDATKNELCQRVWKYFRERERSTRRRFLDAVRAELGIEPKSTYRFVEDRHIRELRDRGFEIGCHSMDHEYMSSLSDEELRSDVRQCREVLGSLLDGAPTLFCYPFGARDSFDVRVIETLKREGFACSCTTIPGLNDNLTNPFALYRIGVYTGTSFPLFVFRLVGLEAGSRKIYRLFKSALTREGGN